MSTYVSENLPSLHLAIAPPPTSASSTSVASPASSSASGVRYLEVDPFASESYFGVNTAQGHHDPMAFIPSSDLELSPTGEEEVEDDHHHHHSHSGHCSGGSVLAHSSGEGELAYMDFDDETTKDEVCYDGSFVSHPPPSSCAFSTRSDPSSMLGSALSSPLHPTPLLSPAIQAFFPGVPAVTTPGQVTTSSSSAATAPAHIQVFCPGVHPELNFLAHLPNFPNKRRHSSPTPTSTPERRKYSTYAIKSNTLERLQPNLASLNLALQTSKKNKDKEAEKEKEKDAKEPVSHPSSTTVSSTASPSNEAACTAIDAVASRGSPSSKTGAAAVSTPAASTASSSSVSTHSREGSTDERDEMAPRDGDQDYEDDDEDDDDDDSSMEFEDDDRDESYLPSGPSTHIIEHKPKRGGRHRRDSRRKDELLPPPSPNTQSDPDLMQDYRQERNRLAAKRSRERKKDYIKQLEGTCRALKAHNEVLNKELVKVKQDIKDAKVILPKKAKKVSQSIEPQQ